MSAPTGKKRAPVDIWSNLGWVRRRIATARRLFLFVDFDGTLAPTVSVPSLAILPEDLRINLRALAMNRDVVTVIISGRAADDLQHRVGLPLIYVGNHGLEIRGAGLNYTVSEAQGLRFQLLAACNRLRASLEPITGALVECKRLTASVHVRQVESAKVSAVIALLQSTMQHYPAFQILRGKEVFDIRPNIPWNKGSAVRWILQQMDGDECDTICIGDDSTDEDMFAELRGGITVRVGFDGLTSAHYCLEETGLLRFLGCVREAVEELHRSPNWNADRVVASEGR